jgi:tetratricopeptide (TPR) repeat protein
VAYKKQVTWKSALGLHKALEIKPDYTHALNNRGMLYAAGRHDKAIRDFEAALKLGELRQGIHEPGSLMLAKETTKAQ